MSFPPAVERSEPPEAGDPGLPPGPASRLRSGRRWSGGLIGLLGLFGLSGLFGPRRASGGDDRSPWRCLRTPSMRWWSVANLLSNTGTWMQLTVQNLLVLEITGSAATTGLSLAVQAAPGLLLGMAGGAVVDAWPRKLTATVSQAVLGVVAFATAALVAFDLLSMPVLMGLAAVTGLIATVDGPATSLLGNDLVKSEDVPSAIALGSVVHSVGRLAGTAVAAVAVGVFGTAVAYLGNGVSFLFVAAVIPFLRLVHKEPVEVPAQREGPAEALESVPNEAPRRARRVLRLPAPRRAPAAGSAREGLAFFLSRPRLVALAGITGLSAVFGRNYQLTLAVLVTGPLHGSASTFGTVSTVLAIGGIVGAVLAGRLQNPSVRLVGALAATGALLQAAAGLSPGLFLLVFLIAPMAVVESLSDTAGTTVLQTDPPAHMRGRVLGVWRSASTGWGLVGPPLLGLLMELAGPRGALVAGGLLIAGAIATGALHHTRRHTRRRARRPVAVPVAVPAAGPALAPAHAPVPAAAAASVSAPVSASAPAPTPVAVPAAGTRLPDLSAAA